MHICFKFFLTEVNTCDLSPLWSMVRVMLAESDHPFNGLTAALVCRAVAVSLEKYGLKKVVIMRFFS